MQFLPCVPPCPHRRCRLRWRLSACAGNKVKKDQSYVARDVETLYSIAKDTLEKRQYKLAAAQFDEVERQHPYSVWARRAQLMSAFSYYVAGRFFRIDLVVAAVPVVAPGQPRGALCLLHDRHQLL